MEGHVNGLDAKTQAKVLQALCEGNSIRSIARALTVGKKAVARLLVDAGLACDRFQDQALPNLAYIRVPCDQICAFVGTGDMNVQADRKNEFRIGDVWAWPARDADTKLMCSWMIGNRSAGAASEFTHDLAGRIASCVELTTDGHRVYANAL